MIAAGENLRGRLESVLRAAHQAVLAGDLHAFLAVSDFPAEIREMLDIEPEAFAEMREMLLIEYPDPAETRFLRTRQVGQDLAGYICYHSFPEDPHFVHVRLYRFRRSGEEWHIDPEGYAYCLEKAGIEDVEGEARALVESEAAFRLE